MTERPVLGILLGDAAGCGPEIVAKMAAAKTFDTYCRPILIGDVRVLERAMDVCKVRDQIRLQVIDKAEDADWSKGLPILDQKDVDPADVPFGVKTIVSGKAMLHMLDLGVQLYQEGKIEGFCFVPLNKAALHDAGCPFESEHHYLAHLLGHTEPFGEINYTDGLMTTRTTSHIPIKDVSKNLTFESISRAIRLIDTTLRNSGLENPRIAVAALNPHGGENGNIGTEEIDVIRPTVEKMQAKGYNVSGPYPSDTLFIKAFAGDFDGVVTMFHDQGQIALKLKDFGSGITIAGGFKIPIVTCGHGTAYDIAGKGLVRTSSFEEAVKMCSKMAVANETK